MGDYFSEYSSFVGAKGLPSPADTPYETPGYIRSKRSSRATVGTSREQSASPPPLPPDNAEYQEKSRDGRYSALDPRRFTPTLHASLVSEILNLRRELDSKNHLVENLETSLSNTRTESETLAEQLTQRHKEIRKAKQHVEQMEQGALGAVEDLARERDAARHSAEELRAKLEVVTKKARRQDEDGMRTQNIWQSEKESWDTERRQLERRVHVTENRLRSFVDEVSAQQATVDAQPKDLTDESAFQDSGLGNESDTTSIQSATPRKHRRNMSSLSYRSRSLRHSTSPRKSTATPELHSRTNGYSLADELDIDEEDEYDIDDFEHPTEDDEYPEPPRRASMSRQGRHGSIGGDADSKAKRVLGLSADMTDSMSKPPVESHARTESLVKPAPDPGAVIVQPTVSPRSQYVDTGYQPSPPPSPKFPSIVEPEQSARHALEVATRVAASPISPPQTPVIDGLQWPEAASGPKYKTSFMQTESVQVKPTATKRDSLQLPAFVPSIAIHPPTSRPSSPRPYVLPPGTRNASAQANVPWPSRDALVQTEIIRVDRRMRNLPVHLLPSHLLPSPEMTEFVPPPKIKEPAGGTAKIFAPRAPPPIEVTQHSRTPSDSSPETAKGVGLRDLRSMPLRAIPLPRPVLAPAVVRQRMSNDGPLNRASQYGVSGLSQSSNQLGEMGDSDNSDDSDYGSDRETIDIAGSIPAFNRAPQGRFGLSIPPKPVPENAMASPDRRPDTSESYGAAPAPSISSSRANSQRLRTRPPPKLEAYRELRSRSPSFNSIASGSSQTTLPPFAIPTRSSSRVLPQTHSEGSHSPTPHQHNGEPFKPGHRASRARHVRQNSLRKVQSAAVMRQATVRTSPLKARRRRRSPALTPVQSMAFESPGQTNFPIPIPDLPTPSQDLTRFDLVKGSVDLNSRPLTAHTLDPGSSQETNLVDAIAATMVGEWMWKYIRKRKSFGITEDNNDTQHGTRHRRWVWLSPYEHTIMWDTKQPTSGTALLGKKGRKLLIQSVLDVRDPSAVPKPADLPTAFDRSILVLTPARALKFTATTRERHTLWITALSFLAQSNSSHTLPAQMPRAPADPTPPIPALYAPTPSSFGRATVRDSVHVAQARRRPELLQSASHPTTATTTRGSNDIDEDEGAAFPTIPRLYISTTRHQRKRSNTGTSIASPRLPLPQQLRSFSSSALTSSNTSRLQASSSSNTSRFHAPSSSSNSNKHGPGGSSLASPVNANFFEAIGTVRMEAFVDPNVRDGVLYVPAPPPTESGVGRRRRGDSAVEREKEKERRRGWVCDENGLDPFKGF